MEILLDSSPLSLTVIFSCICWLSTALGASIVTFFNSKATYVLNAFSGFAAGVMISASFWSLLNPSISLCEELNYSKIIPIVSFLVSAILVVLFTILLDKIFANKSKSILMFSAVTLHNVPEGLCVGVAFGAVNSGVNLISAITLSLGMAIQNFPEGASVSLPLLRDGIKKRNAFFLGQLSGAVEPIFAIIGYFLTTIVKAILPITLSMAAGAMITVAVGELIPDSITQNKTVGIIGCIIGFAIMSLLDVLA